LKGWTAASAWSAAENGREALNALDEAGADLLITDIRMPVMDGIELIQRSMRSSRTWSAR
jgi:two-component system response regulator YesN